MVVPRNLAPVLLRLARQRPVVAVIGPRQSGKTTLCRNTFPDLAYVSLEPLDVRDFAVSDPRGFLATYRSGAVIDEVQRAPSLFSYLQEEVDRESSPGRFVLTGSQHFGLTAGITQTLAGRIGLRQLLPLSLDEIGRFEFQPSGLWQTVWSGGYPRIYDRQLDPGEWLADYVATYVQRDVRQIVNVTDLGAFTTFLRLAAARSAQELNLSVLGADAGVTHNTVRSWVSVLEASFVVYRIASWSRSLRKRAVKTAKLHFVDTGLACHLLGIRSAAQLELHPLRGAIFENWVASEILKARVHAGLAADLFHVRQTRGLEIDLIVEAENDIYAVEAKSGATVTAGMLNSLSAFLGDDAAGDMRRRAARLVYGGDRRAIRNEVEVIPWSDIQKVEW